MVSTVLCIAMNWEPNQNNCIFRFLYTNITRYVLFDVVIVECLRYIFYRNQAFSQLLYSPCLLQNTATSHHSVELPFGLYLMLQAAASSSGCTSYIQVLRFHIVIILHLRVQGSEGSGPPSSFTNSALCGYNDPSKSKCWKLF